MTITPVLFASVTTAYILVAIQFEERDLMRLHPEYAEYRRRVPMLVPFWRQKANAVDTNGPTKANPIRSAGA
jgi:hypothetical protein